MHFDLSTIVGLLLTASGGAFVREVLLGIAKVRSGVASTERGRKVDVVAQRNDALAKQGHLEHDVEVLQQYISDLREFCLAHGTPLNSLPRRPSI